MLRILLEETKGIPDRCGMPSSQMCAEARSQQLCRLRQQLNSIEQRCGRLSQPLFELFLVEQGMLKEDLSAVIT